jgi:hypothetical protein
MATLDPLVPLIQKIEKWQENCAKLQHALQSMLSENVSIADISVAPMPMGDQKKEASKKKFQKNKSEKSMNEAVDKTSLRYQLFGDKPLIAGGVVGGILNRRAEGRAAKAEDLAKSIDHDITVYRKQKELLRYNDELDSTQKNQKRQQIDQKIRNAQEAKMKLVKDKREKIATQRSQELDVLDDKIQTLRYQHSKANSEVEDLKKTAPKKKASESQEVFQKRYNQWKDELQTAINDLTELNRKINKR